jgi:APA family basic amino acid/polyamine antiporter
MSDASVTMEETSGGAGDDAGARPFDIPKVSALTATAIAVADMVGTGVFTSLGFQVRDIPSGFSLLILWVVGGVVALCGALSYAELAAAFPRSGGEYNFLSRAFRPALGFMAGWVSATVGFAAPVALAAMAFGQYFAGVVPGAPAVALGLGATCLVSLVHIYGIQGGSLLQNVSTLVKLGLIAILIIAGLGSTDVQPISFAPTAADIGYLTSAPFALSLVFVLYAYSGWNAATYIAGEIHDPQRNLPRSILAAVLIVTALYVALNATFLRAAPMSELAGQIDVGLIAGRHIFGEDGGRFVAALICIGLVSSISAMMWIGPRVTMTMGEDNPTLKVFAQKSGNGVPVNALLFQLFVSAFLLFTQSFEAVLDFIQFALTACSFLTVLGVIVLRRSQPRLRRPYLAWGYPFTPYIFLAVTGFVLAHLVIERPLQSLASVLTMMAGLFIYALSQKRSSRSQ